MSGNDKHGFLNDELSKRTSIFGLRLWVVLGICVGAAIVLVMFLISLWFTSRRSKQNPSSQKPTIQNVSKEIQEIRIDPNRTQTHYPDPVPEPDQLAGAAEQKALLLEDESQIGRQRNIIHIEIGKGHRIAYPERGGGGFSGSADQVVPVPVPVPEVSHLGWGHWYTLRELEVATDGFSDENVIGEGGYGIVYSGVLEDNTRVAVKNLLNNRYLNSLLIYIKRMRINKIY